MDTAERQIKRSVLSRIDRCSICHRAFESEDIHVLSRKPDVWMMVVQCADCHARSFVAALLADGDPTAARMALRRLTAELVGADEEATKAPSSPPVSTDDVLDMHDFLKGFDGDFKQLFRASRSG